MRCPVFDPAPYVIARGPGGEVCIRWWAAPLDGVTRVRADGAGGVLGGLPGGRDGVSPGHGLAATVGGARWSPAPGRGRWLGWVVRGAEHLQRWQAGVEITLTPA